MKADHNQRRKCHDISAISEISCIEGYRHIGPAIFRDKSLEIGDFSRYIGDFSRYIAWSTWVNESQTHYNAATVLPFAWG